MVTTPLSEKISLTKDVEKVTDALADTLLMKKKSLTKDDENGNDELEDTLLSEKTSLTKDLEKGTDELADTLLTEKKSLTKDVEKGTDELADKLLMNKKSSTKDVDEGNDELAFMKQKVSTIRRKSLYQYEVQPIGSKGWFKLDIEFFKPLFLNVIHNSIKHCLKRALKINTWKYIKRFL